MQSFGTLIKIVAVNSLTIFTVFTGVLPNIQPTKAAGELYEAKWEMTKCRVVKDDSYNFSFNHGRSYMGIKETYTFLGPAEWTVKYTVGTKRITEKWSVDSWMDTIPFQVEGTNGKVYEPLTFVSVDKATTFKYPKTTQELGGVEAAGKTPLTAAARIHMKNACNSTYVAGFYTNDLEGRKTQSTGNFTVSNSGQYAAMVSGDTIPFMFTFNDGSTLSQTFNDFYHTNSFAAAPKTLISSFPKSWKVSATAE